MSQNDLYDIPNDPFCSRELLLMQNAIRGGTCIGYENLVVTDAAAVAPTIPADTVQARLIVAANAATAIAGRALRFREDGTDPTAANGMLLGDLSVYFISNPANLANLKLIGIDAGLSHNVHIQYYS